MWWIHPVEYGMANLKNQTVHEWNNLDKCHKLGVERRKSNTKKYVLYVEKSEIVTSGMIALTSKGHQEMSYI